MIQKTWVRMRRMVSWRKEGGREGARIQPATQAPTSVREQTAVGHELRLTLTPTQPSQSCVCTRTQCRSPNTCAKDSNHTQVTCSWHAPPHSTPRCISTHMQAVTQAHPNMPTCAHNTVSQLQKPRPLRTCARTGACPEYTDTPLCPSTPGTRHRHFLTPGSSLGWSLETGGVVVIGHREAGGGCGRGQLLQEDPGRQRG